jgi:hypothetical protein
MTNLGSGSQTRYGYCPGEDTSSKAEPASDPNPCTARDCGCNLRNIEILLNLGFLNIHTRKQKKEERRKTRWSKGAVAMERTTPNPMEQRQRNRAPVGAQGHYPPPPKCHWPCSGPKGSPGWEAYQGPPEPWRCPPPGPPVVRPH